MKKNTKKKKNNSSKKALNIDEIGNIDDVFYRKIKKIKIKIKISNNRESVKGGEERRGEEKEKTINRNHIKMIRIVKDKDEKKEERGKKFFDKRLIRLIKMIEIVKRIKKNKEEYHEEREKENNYMKKVTIVVIPVTIKYKVINIIKKLIFIQIKVPCSALFFFSKIFFVTEEMLF